MADIIDPDQTAAETLVAALRAIGIRAVLHQDRSPWGARIPLTEDRGEYQTPSLFVLLEAGYWFGSLGGFDQDVDEAFQSVHIQLWHHDGDPAKLAATLEPLVALLRGGAKVPRPASRYRTLEEVLTRPSTPAFAPPRRKLTVSYRNEVAGDLIVVTVGGFEGFTLTVSDYTADEWEVVLNHGDPEADDYWFSNVTGRVGTVDVGSPDDQAELARRLVFYVNSNLFDQDIASFHKGDQS